MMVKRRGRTATSGNGREIPAWKLPRFVIAEGLIAAGILVLVVAMVSPRFAELLKDTRGEHSVSQTKTPATDLDRILVNAGRYSSETEELDALDSSPLGVKRWNAPYTPDGVVSNDPWGHSYLYHHDDRRSRVPGLGADGALGGPGDAEDFMS